MSSPITCPFCATENKPEVINAGDAFVSLLSNPRLRYGHALVVPRRHVETPMDLQPAEILAIYTEIQRLQRIIIDKLAPGCDTWQKYQPFVPQGKVKVNHVHFHVIPRKPDDRLFMTPEASQWDIFEPLSETERKEVLTILR